MPISLDGLRMNAVQTAPGGVVDRATVFQFHQHDQDVWAEYAGGRVRRGYLVGRIDGARLTFRYCQAQDDGVLDGGRSECEVHRRDGLVQVVERFQWESRPGSGENILQELGGSC